MGRLARGSDSSSVIPSDRMGAQAYQRGSTIRTLGLLASVTLGAVAWAPPTVALAASQPAIEGLSTSFVDQHDAGLQAWVNPEGLSSRGAVYQFQVVSNPSEFLPEIACPYSQHTSLGGGGCTGAPTRGALPIGSLPSGSEGRQAQVSLLAEGVGLEPGTTYHFRVLAATAKASEDQLEWEAPPVHSEEQTFTTAPATTAPVVIESEAASHVSSSDATLEATINPENLQRGALYQFQLVSSSGEYFSTFVCPAGWAQSSICLGLDSEVQGLPTRVSSAGQKGQAVSLDLADAGVTLTPNTTYHYRVIAATSVLTEDTTDWEGPTVEGADQTFTTPAVGPAPVIDSVSISHLTPTDATLEAQINTEGLSTSYEFEMQSSPCSKHGSGCELIVNVDLPSGLLLGSFVDQDVSLDLNSAGVSLGDGEYSYSVRATNAAGTTYGDWQTFEAPSAVLDPPGPTVSPGPVSDEPAVALRGAQDATSALPASTLGGPSKTGVPKRRTNRHRRKHHGTKSAKHRMKHIKLKR